MKRLLTIILALLLIGGTIGIVSAADTCTGAATTRAPKADGTQVTLYKAYVDLTSNSMACTYTPKAQGAERLVAVTFSASEAISETVTIVITDPSASTYDHTYKSNTLSSGQYYDWIPDQGLLLYPGQTVKLTSTNGNTTGTLYVTIVTEDTPL